jgi:hypothetical protein
MVALIARLEPVNIENLQCAGKHVQKNRRLRKGFTDLFQKIISRLRCTVSAANELTVQRRRFDLQQIFLAGEPVDEPKLDVCKI